MNYGASNDQIHKFHNAPIPYRGIVGYGTGEICGFF